jgi:hypothetical protein
MDMCWSSKQQSTNNFAPKTLCVKLAGWGNYEISILHQLIYLSHGSMCLADEAMAKYIFNHSHKIVRLRNTQKLKYYLKSLNLY